MEHVEIPNIAVAEYYSQTLSPAILQEFFDCKGGI